MKTLLKPWFIASCLMWLAIYTLQRLHIFMPPLINDHLTDLIAVPVLANLGLAFQRTFIVKSPTYQLKNGHIIFIVLYVSLVFEVLLPKYSAKYTSDWVDVIMYCLGGLVYRILINKSVINLLQEHHNPKIS